MTNDVAPGRGRTELFVVLTTADTTKGEVGDAFDAHIAHQVELEAAGVLVAAGPFMSDTGRMTGGMMLVRAESLAEVEALMERDPFTATGCSPTTSDAGNSTRVASP